MKTKLHTQSLSCLLLVFFIFSSVPLQGDTEFYTDSTSIQKIQITPLPNRQKSTIRIQYPTMKDIIKRSWVQVGFTASDQSIGNSLAWTAPFQVSEITKQKKTTVKSHYKTQSLGIELMSTRNNLRANSFILPTYQIRWIRSEGWLYQFTANAGFTRSRSIVPAFQISGGSFNNTNDAYNYFCSKAAIGIGHKVNIGKNFFVYPYLEIGTYLQMPYNNAIYRGNTIHLGLNFPVSIK